MYPRGVTARTLVLAALAAAAPALAAETPAPGGLPDVVGPRALALSAGIGMAASNEGMFLNPAGVGARKRYSIEAGAFVDRRGADNVQELFGGSVVDSMSSPLTGGFAYFRSQEGSYTGNGWNVLLSAPIAENVYMGFNGKYFDVSGAKATRAVTVDAGLYWQLGELVSFGAAGYNLVPIANETIAPMGVGAGIAIGSDRIAQVTADWRSDFDRAAKTANSYGAGVEVLVARVLPLRAGFLHDEVLGGNWWSAGAGLVSQSGVALDVGYRQSFDDKSARTLAANLKLFLFR
jgi:hypothetical protein